MQLVHTIAEVRAAVSAWRDRGESVAFVPTMGNLHDGHSQLVAEARRRADRVVVSIFVNPLQFGQGEDFATYPRTLEADCTKLTGGADLVFAPAEREMYPRGREQLCRVQVPAALADILCGAARPGHFSGVATVVAKLFGIVRPDIAVFGEKDYQQLLVVRRLVEDLNLGVAVVGLPTVRAPDGLALSSRNGYLSDEQRQLAPGLFAALQEAGQALEGGARDYGRLEARGLARLADTGLVPEYFSIRRAEDLVAPRADDTAFAVLAAARLGGTRLIDNLLIGAGEWD